MSSLRQLVRCALAIVYGHRLCEDATQTGYPQGFWCRYTTEPVELSARGLGCSYAKVLEYLPAERRLIVRAGIGWPAGTVDHVTLGADIGSPVAFAYQTGQSGMSNHLEQVIRLPNAETSRRTWDQARDKRAYPAGWRGRHLSRSRTSPSRLSTRVKNNPERQEVDCYEYRQNYVHSRNDSSGWRQPGAR